MSEHSTSELRPAPCMVKYGVKHMVKDHSDREETHCNNTGYSFRLAIRITHTTAFVTPVVEHWLEQDTAQWVHHEGLIQ